MPDSKDRSDGSGLASAALGPRNETGGRLGMLRSMEKGLGELASCPIASSSAFCYAHGNSSSGTSAHMVPQKQRVDTFIMVHCGHSPERQTMDWAWCSFMHYGPIDHGCLLPDDPDAGASLGEGHHDGSGVSELLQDNQQSIVQIVEAVELSA